MWNVGTSFIVGFCMSLSESYGLNGAYRASTDREGPSIYRYSLVKADEWNDLLGIAAISKFFPDTVVGEGKRPFDSGLNDVEPMSKKCSKWRRIDIDANIC